MTVTVGALIRQATALLEEAGVPGAARDARLLVSAALDIPMARLSFSMDDTADEARVMALIKRRAAREPVSHLIGGRAFFKHDFLVTPDVLDPRPETETLVLAALEQPFARVLDLGTGSGAIILSLLADCPAATGVATDISEGALTVAQKNAARLGVADRITFVQSDWFENIEGTFDLIVSNPPYIALDEMAGLAPELGYEPRMALTDEADGLSAYRRIAAGAMDHLTPQGRVIVEFGATQARDVAAIFADHGYQNIKILQDLNGHDRILVGHVG